MRRYLCGVKTECTAGNIQAPSGMIRAHTSPVDAFFCKRNELLRQGYKQIGQREFQLDDGPILVLTKKSRYGGLLRHGKADKSTKRGAYKDRSGGCIIS